MAGFEWSSYVKMSIHVFGIITNIVNLCVFLSPKLKDTSYRLMMGKSIANLVYFSISIESEIINACVNCSFSTYYFTYFNMIVVAIFGLSSLAVFRILIDLALSIYTYCILVNRPWPGKHTYIFVLLILLLVSLLYNAHKLFMFSIIQLPNRAFFFAYTDFGRSEVNQILLVALTFVRIFISLVCVTVINMFNMVKFNRRFKSRIFSIHTQQTNVSSRATIKPRQTDEKQRSSMQNDKNLVMTRNFTQMVIVSLFINVIGQTPFSVCFIIGYLGVNSPDYSLANTYSAFFIILVPALDLFCYFLFNKLFRTVLNEYCKSIFCLFYR